MTVPSDPYNFVNATTADGDQVDARFAPLYAALNGGLEADNMTTATREQLGLSDPSSKRRGKFIQATAGSMASTSFGQLSNGPDLVDNIVLPTDGFLCVVFQALWQESLPGIARASVYLDGLAIKGGAVDGAPVTQQACTAANTEKNLDAYLYSCSQGLASNRTSSTATGASAPVTTGQIVGAVTAAGNYLYNNALNRTIDDAGVCLLYAAAGTYDVEVKYAAQPSGTVTVKSRKLLVWTIGF